MHEVRIPPVYALCVLSGCEAKVQVVDNSSLLSDQIKKGKTKEVEISS